MADENENLLGTAQKDGEGAPPEDAALETEVEVKADDEGGEPAEPQDDGTEKEAREMGWVPFAEWRGPKAAWKPAEEFARRGREFLPIVQARARKAEERLREMERTFEDRFEAQQRDFDERMAKLTRANAATTRAALQRQASTLWKNFEEQKARAVESGDTEAYNSLRERQIATMEEYSKAEEDIDAFEQQPAAEQQKKPASDGLTPYERKAVEAWVGQNPWFNRDRVLTVNAQMISAELRAEVPGLSPEENLTRTAEILKEKFPEKFGIKPRVNGTAAAPRHVQSVEGGGRQPGGGSKPKGFTDLPPEAKQSFKELVQHGIYADDPSGRSKYANAYWEA